MKLILYPFLLFINMSFLIGQGIIEIKNPSFEGEATRGGNSGRFHLKGWWDCGYKGCSPPDIHSNTSVFFHVTTLPSQGKTFLGLIAREDETWERVSQKLKSPLLKEQQYSISMDLCRSDKYKSKLKPDQNDISSLESTLLFNFNSPLIIRIWGGNGYCNHSELLDESPLIVNTEWKRYEFILIPSANYSQIEVEAYYAPSSNEPYNGNVLIDNLSDIYRIDE